MLFELRQYRIHPGKRDEWVKFMDEVIIPFQASKGMVIVASFVAEDDPDLYVWIRRFDDEEDRKRLYAAVYESDFWKNEVSPKVPDMLDRAKIVVTRLNPTAKSVLR
ncbi:MAG: NIPSNAP family protein [Caldilineaceae bacterium]|nr:NIPSNAP family protein [Caldilineaceae bacterium]